MLNKNTKRNKQLFTELCASQSAFTLSIGHCSSKDVELCLQLARTQMRRLSTFIFDFVSETV